MQVSIYVRKPQILEKKNTPDIPSISLSHFPLQFPHRHLHRSQPMIFLQFWPLEKYILCNEMRDRKHCTHINHSYRFTLLTRVILPDFLRFTFFYGHLFTLLYSGKQHLQFAFDGWEERRKEKKSKNFSHINWKTREEENKRGRKRETELNVFSVTSITSLIIIDRLLIY